MGLILDLVFVAVVIVTAFLSSKKGFVRTLLELVGFVAAIVIALTVSEPVSEFAYDKFVEPAIVEKTQGIIVNTATEIPENLWENLPNIIKNNSEFFDINEENFLKTISDEAQNGAIDISETISRKIVRPSVINIFSTVICFLLILILLPIFRFIAKIINKLFSFSIVGKLNHSLGGILGIVKGMAICIIICIVIDLLLKVTGGGFWVLTPELLNKSFIFSKIFPLIF